LTIYKGEGKKRRGREVRLHPLPPKKENFHLRKTPSVRGKKHSREKKLNDRNKGEKRKILDRKGMEFRGEIDLERIARKCYQGEGGDLQGKSSN